MAEDRQIYEQAMARGRELQEKNQWDEAFREFYRAASEFKSDVQARVGVAQALMHLNRLEQALPQFQALYKVRPNVPEVARGYAEALAKSNRTQEAIEVLYKLRDLALENGQPLQQIEVLSDIIGLDESRTEAYFDIIKIYVEQGDKPSAAAVGVELARYFQKTGDTEQALAVIVDVLELDPHNPDAPALKQMLEGGEPMPRTGDLPELPELDDPLAMLDDVPLPKPVETEEEPPHSDASTLIADAERFLENGDTTRAIRHYEMAVEAGSERADVFYSLGQLYAQENMPGQAVNWLQRAAGDAEYAVSAYFSLGQVYDNLGDHRHAAAAYENALAHIDLSFIDESAVDELIDMYEATMHSYEAAGNSDEVKTLYKRLATFIQENNFRTEKAMMVLVKNRELNPLPPPLSTLPEISTEELNKLTGKDYSSFSRTVEPVEEASFGEDESQTSSKIPGFSESITFTSTGELVRTGTGEEIELPEAQTGASTAVAPEEPGTNAPTEMTIPEIFPTELINQDQNQYAMPYLRASKDFLQRDLLMAATDAAHEMIRYFPEYLPAQTVLAEIYVKKGWLEMARTKYQFVVDLYERRGDSAKQLWAYRRLATISPQNMQLRSKLANKLMENGMKEEAAELLLDALDNYVRSGQIDRALDECRKLRTIAPNNTNIRLQYGELLNRVDKYNEALVEFRRALEIDPDNLRALCQLNITLFLSDTTDLRWTSFKSVLDASAGNKEARNKVITEYRQALFLFNHPGLNYVLGCLNIEAQQVNPAIRSFDEVLRMASMDPAMTEYELLSRWELSQLYIQAVRYNEAIDMMTRVVSLLEKVDAKGFIGPGYRYGSLPTQASIYRKMAESFNALGQKEYAVKALKSVKRLLPYDRQVYFELAELYFEQGQLSEALNELGELAEHYEQSSQTENVVEVLKEMTRLAPNNIEVRDKLATVYLNRGMTDLGLSELDLLADLQKKVGKMKDAVRSLQRGAEIYFMMGRLDRAFELYDRIVRIAPGDIEARQHLVNLHILAGRMKDAIDEQRTIAQICLQNNNMQEAIGALHQVIGLSPDDTRAYFTLADVLKNVGKYGEAYRLYGQIIKREPDNDKAKALQSQIKQKAIEAGQLDADKVK